MRRRKGLPFPGYDGNKYFRIALDFANDAAKRACGVRVMALRASPLCSVTSSIRLPINSNDTDAQSTALSKFFIEASTREEKLAIHVTSLIAEGAQIGADVDIGPFAVVGKATIGPGVIIHSHAVIGDNVEIDEGTEVFPGALIGREPKGAGATSRQVSFERRIHIGKRCSIGAHAVIYYDVLIGSRTLIGDGASIREQCRIGSNVIISRYVTLNYNVTVGDNVKVMDLTHLTGNMVVEDGAFISCLVASMNDNAIRQGFGEHVVGPIVHRDAIIGGGAILLPAVEIGEAAFVGAGAVVTRGVPTKEKWLGMPAKPKS